MKKFDCIVVSLVAFCFVMGCSNEKGKSIQNESIKENSQVQLSEESSQAEWSFQEVNVNGSEYEFIVSARDLYEGGGCGWYQCGEQGVYRFERTGTLEDIYSTHPEEIIWKVYVLDQPFSEEPRFLPQAGYKEALVGDGSVEVEKGQYIVIYCSQNSYEYGLKEGYDGDEDASYQCAFEE